MLVNFIFLNDYYIDEPSLLCHYSYLFHTFSKWRLNYILKIYLTIIVHSINRKLFLPRHEVLLFLCATCKYSFTNATLQKQFKALI